MNKDQNMTEEQLIHLCLEPDSKKKIYWTSEIYGFGQIIRKYGFYPSFLPLNIYFVHGVPLHENPALHELTNKAPFMFYFSTRLVEAFRRVSKKPCFCLISPNAFYRRKNSIVQDKNAEGTLAFLCHTSAAIEDRMDFNRYSQQLKQLPEKFQPVTICIHYHDINKGVHKYFLKEGFEVATVGHPFRKDFIKAFYDLIRSYRYLTSNEIGSYAFYGPEAGIPFFLYGNEPDLYNHGDPNIEFGSYTSYRQTNQYHAVRKLFLYPHDCVTPEQRAMVEKELGVYESISRVKLAVILYVAYFLYLKMECKKLIYRLFKSTGMFIVNRNRDILKK